MREDYAKAKKIGDRTRRLALSRGEYPYLVTLSTVALDFDKLPKISCGLHEVPLRLIAGTVTEGRHNAFARDFMPVLAEDTEFAMKWAALYDSQQEEGIREPAKLYEYMNRFYVLEGNKRVSVSKYAGASDILANVTRVMPRPSESKEYQVYREFLKFYEASGQFEPVFSEPGSYMKLSVRYGESAEIPWKNESVEAMRADFKAFLHVFYSRGGASLKMTPGDAFLLYLNFYPTCCPLLDSVQTTEKQLMSIWDELVSVTRAESIARIEALPVKRRSAGLLSFRKPVWTKEHPLKCAFLYAGSPESSRWIYGHELGRLDVDSHFDGLVKTAAFEECVTEEAVDHTLETAAAGGYDVIFTTSATMMDASMRYAVRYPRLRILNCSLNLMSSRVRTYYPKMYEAKLLMGALAASFSSDHRIGYLADYPIYGSLANINAFAIGAALIDPGCRVFLKWSGEKGRDWEGEFKAEEIHLISGPDMIRPKNASRRYGVYYLSTDDDGNENVMNLAAPIYDWGNYYRRIITSVLDGSFDGRENVDKTTALNYWYGISAGVIDIIFSKELPYYSRKLVGLLRDGILSGAVTPFRGEIHSQEKMLSPEGGEAMKSSDIITMDWLNDNVVGTIPPADAFVADIRGTLMKMGVRQ